jgi:hypothetical protein
VHLRSFPPTGLLLRAKTAKLLANAVDDRTVRKCLEHSKCRRVSGLVPQN